MRILWVCNIVMPEFAGEFDIKPAVVEGWMTGMLHCLEQMPDMEVGLCFPIIDEWRMKNGVLNKHHYYSFHAVFKGEYDLASKREFIEIIKDFKPDVVQIWGTEYNHARAVLDACIDMGIREKVLVCVQGLVYYCAFHYTLGIPPKYLLQGSDILEGQADFSKRGENEKYVIQNACHICDATEWGELCVKLFNPKVHFYHIDDILRDSFYENIGKWDLQKCQRHSIFISQAYYPIKGFHFLIRAFQIVQERFKDAKIYVSGSPLPKDNTFTDYIEDLINEYNVGDYVKFLGSLSEEEMCEQYLKSHVFVSPSVIENHSNSVSEATMLGVPVISTYVGGMQDLITHGKDGFLYPADAHYSLAAYIMKIFSNDDLAITISKNAIEKAKARHDKDKIGGDIRKIYKSIVG